MMIKTVVYPLYQAHKFDIVVNRLLTEGWKLKKRETVRIQGEVSEAFNTPIISAVYAELEKDIPEFEEVTE